MSHYASTAKYLESDVLSRSKEWLVPLLYEHLLAGLRRASVQIEVGDIEGKAASLEKAAAIVFELVASLDGDQGEIAGSLASLYAFFADEILTVGRSLDRNRLESVTKMVADLHDAWTQAAEQVAPLGTGRSIATSAA